VIAKHSPRQITKLGFNFYVKIKAMVSGIRYFSIVLGGKEAFENYRPVKI
jgi:hypothetical protein